MGGTTTCSGSISTRRPNEDDEDHGGSFARSFPSNDDGRTDGRKEAHVGGGRLDRAPPHLKAARAARAAARLVGARELCEVVP